MFETENAFYKAHQAEFQEKYLEKWLVIAGDSLFGIFDSAQDAFTEAMKYFKPGQFMLHMPADDFIVVGPGRITRQYPDHLKKPKPKQVSFTYV